MIFRAILYAAVFAILAGCGYSVILALRKGYVRGSQRSAYIYRRDNPGGYWANVILMGLFFILGIWVAVDFLTKK